MPSGSRKPITASGASSTAANAPRMRDIASIVASREASRVLGDQRADDLGVGRRVEMHATLEQLVAQLGRVREVAVVAERDGPAGTVPDDRLRVLPVRRAGRRVARVADRGLTHEGAQLGLVEHLRRRVPSRGARSPGVRPRPRSRRSPAPGAAGRTSRSRRVGRRRGPGARMPKTPHISAAPWPAGGRSRTTRARRRARRRRRTSRARTTMRSPPSRPSSTTGTPDAGRSRRGAPARPGAQVTSTLPQASPNSVMSPRSAQRGQLELAAAGGAQAELGDRDDEPAVGGVVRRGEQLAPRRLAERSEQAGELGQGGIGDAPGRRAVLERLPLACRRGRAPPHPGAGSTSVGRSGTTERRARLAPARRPRRRRASGGSASPSARCRARRCRRRRESRTPDRPRPCPRWPRAGHTPSPAARGCRS